jgi:TolB-like protein/Flp pilus assembly protein TadD
LTRTEFDSALKDALRHYTRADLLAGNPLLQSQTMKRQGSAAGSAQDLRTMLVETAETLFANTRDQKLYRVLDLTYFNPAPKQEAAADRLGLAFSTYRRYLGIGVERVAEWLWRLEQDASQKDQVTQKAAVFVRIPRNAGQPEMRRPLSIIVLPFLNLSHDAELGNLADGVVDNLMTDLSRALPDSFVISRSTAFAYRGRQVPVRQIGQELRVRYLLEGSVFADATRVRVNAQLIDAQTDEHLWAERFDKEREDVLQLQEEIVARLSRSVGIEMLRKEGERSRINGSECGDATDLVMRAKALVTDIRQQENALQAVSLFQRALALDPDNVEALVGIASTCIFQLLNRYRTDERDRLLDGAEDLISRAFALAPDHIGVLKARAVLCRARGRFDEAIVATWAVIERSPGEPTAYRELGLNKLYLGETLEAAGWFRRADRVAPRDPMRWTWLQGLGRALMQLGQDAEAAAVLRQVVDSNPGWARGKALLAASEALAGNVDCARRHLAEYAARNPGMTIGKFADEHASVPLAAVSPTYRRENEHILEGLRRAGMPDCERPFAPI